MYVVALTGGIGSGKTVIADLFATLRVPIIDTDVIAHQLTAVNGMALPALRASFGADFIRADGSLDRSKMRLRIFNQAQDKKKLEAILHPLIRTQVRIEIQELMRRADVFYAIVVVPLFVELVNTSTTLAEPKSWRSEVDRILVVDCPPALQLERVVARSHLVPEQVQAIMATQADRSERLAVADDVIVNDSELKSLNKQVAYLHGRYLELAKIKP